jgi:hypothetical protein
LHDYQLFLLAFVWLFFEVRKFEEFNCFRSAMVWPCRTVVLVAHRNSQFFKQPWRFFGGLDTSPSSIMRNPEVQTIYSETVNIPNHGRLEIRCPFNLYVTPIHQKDFPRLDKAFFTIYGIDFIV